MVCLFLERYALDWLDWLVYMSTPRPSSERKGELNLSLGSILIKVSDGLNLDPSLSYAPPDGCDSYGGE